MSISNPYTTEQLAAAVEELSDPERLEAAQAVVTKLAPGLTAILHDALRSSEWFGSAHQSEVLKAAGVADPDERLRQVQALIAEETDLSMLIGVAVGFELRHILESKSTGGDVRG